MLSQGGGGWGDPLERKEESVLADVRDGLVSEEAALRLYGIVLGWRQSSTSMLSNAAFSVPPWYSIEAAITPPALAMKSGIERIPRSCIRLLSHRGRRYVGTLQYEPRLQRIHVRVVDDVWSSGRDPNIAVHTNHIDAAQSLASCVFGDAPAVRLER
jgi:hypothetical protein